MVLNGSFCTDKLYSGRCGKLGIRGSGSYHEAFSATKICALTDPSNGVSKVPKRIRTNSGCCREVAYKGEPHERQKWRHFPADDSKTPIAASPSVIENASFGTETFAAKALPLAFRQLRQWQYVNPPAVASKRNFTLWHKQEPCCILNHLFRFEPPRMIASCGFGGDCYFSSLRSAPSLTLGWLRSDLRLFFRDECLAAWLL